MNLKKTVGISAICFGGFSLLIFLMFFLPNYVISGEVGNFGYVIDFFGRLVEFCLPVVGGVICLCISVFFGRGAVLSSCAILSATRALYLLPYYYLYFIAYGYDSIESILLSAVVTILGVALEFGLMLLLCYVARASAMRGIRKGMTDAEARSFSRLTKDEGNRLMADKLADILCGRMGLKYMFDLACPIKRGIFFAVICQFAVSLVQEVARTLNYLISYAGYYRVDEIIYMMISYIFILFEMILAQVLCCIIKEKIRFGGEGGCDGEL